MIRQLKPYEFSLAAKVIRTSFATVAKDFGFNEQNFPTFTGFVITEQRLQTQLGWGALMFGLFGNEQLVGYVSITKSKEIDGVYELNNLAVHPDYRHKGYGKQLLDFCKAKAKELGGFKINIGITEENTALKNWYTANGFVHTGTKKFDHMPITAGYMEWEVK